MSEEVTEKAPAAGPRTEDQGATEAPASRGGAVLHGTSVAPGLVLGVVHRKDHDLTSARAHRVPRDEIDQELNRFRGALNDSGAQLKDLKRRLEGRVKPDDARILDTHLAYLKDSVFIADVENLILNDQLALEGAIAKVIGDFDRIFRLVENETLRQSAVDLRDVAIRVLRNLEEGESGEEGGEEAPTDEPMPAGDYILAAPELSIVDMFNLSNEHVRGIVTEEGGLTSHAAIFARSMRIPTVTAVEGLLDTVIEGDFLILDASEGVVRINPDEVVRQQYLQADESDGDEDAEAGVPEWARRPARTRDGIDCELRAICGNLPEAEQARAHGMSGLGLYRTELLYLIDKDPPSREALVRHYLSVIEHAGATEDGGAVTFRLLNVDAGLEIPYLDQGRELNPQLGRAGVRMLLANEGLLRRQLQAILIAARDVEVRIAIPFVVDCGELRRVREILFEEKRELQRSQTPFQDRVALGCVLETPAALLGIRDLARECDFLYLNLDAATQYLLAADRESADLSRLFEVVHPYVLRAVRKICAVAKATGRELAVFGGAVSDPRNLSMLIGAGVRSFLVSPTELRAYLDGIAGTDSSVAESGASAACKSACADDLANDVSAFRDGYIRP